MKVEHIVGEFTPTCALLLAQFYQQTQCLQTGTIHIVMGAVDPDLGFPYLWENHVDPETGRRVGGEAIEITEEMLEHGSVEYYIRQKQAA